MLGVLWGAAGSAAARRVAIGALVAAGAMGWGAATGCAVDFADGNNNVCEGVSCFNPDIGPDHAMSNVGFGFTVMPSLTSGSDNVGVSRDALFSMTTGERNTGVGAESLFANSTG